MKNAVLFLLVSFPLFSGELTINDPSWKLVGKALLEVTVFKVDVYNASYFKKEKSELLTLSYLRDVEKKYSLQGWDAGFEHLEETKDNEIKEAIKWIRENTGDLKESETFSILKHEGVTTFYKNKKAYATTKLAKVYELVLTPWIGDNAVDKSLKKGLLGI